MTKPVCMSADEYIAWSDANLRVLAVSQQASSPCHDCPASFALEMREVDRCDGHPRGYQGDDDPSHPMTFPQQRSREVRAATKAARARATLELLRTGITQAETAQRLGLAPSTVSKYVNEAP